MHMHPSAMMGSSKRLYIEVDSSSQQTITPSSDEHHPQQGERSNNDDNVGETTLGRVVRPVTSGKERQGHSGSTVLQQSHNHFVPITSPDESLAGDNGNKPQQRSILPETIVPDEPWRLKMRPRNITFPTTSSEEDHDSQPTTEPVVHPPSPCLLPIISTTMTELSSSSTPPDTTTTPHRNFMALSLASPPKLAFTTSSEQVEEDVGEMPSDVMLPMLN